MAPIDSVAHLPCGMAYPTYPPPFCTPEPRTNGTIRPREVKLPADAATASMTLSKRWAADSRGILKKPWTWIGILLGLVLMVSIVVLCYQCWKDSKERRRRREEEGIELPSTPRSNSFMNFRQRKERKAAERRIQKEQEWIARCSGGGHSSAGSNQDLLDEARWSSPRDGDYPLVRHVSNVDSSQPTAAHFCHNGDESGAWRHLVDHSPFEPASDESRSSVSRPSPAYGSQCR